MPGLEDHDSVTAGEKAIDFRLQFSAQLHMIMDAAVKSDRQIRLGIDHWRLGGVAEIADLQSVMSQRGGPLRVKSGRAGPFLRHRRTAPSIAPSSTLLPIKRSCSAMPHRSSQPFVHVNFRFLKSTGRMVSSTCAGIPVAP
jgi:hypothetical protein